MTRRIDISSKTVFFITAFLILLWTLYQILDIILLFFVAFIFMSALSPLVDKLVNWRIPRVLAVLMVFLLLLISISALITLGFAPLVSQVNNLGQRLIDALNGVFQTAQIDKALVQQELSRLSGEAVNVTLSVFQNVISLVSAIVVTLYMLLDKTKIEEFGTSFFGSRQAKAKRVLLLIEDKLGAWLRGQVVLSLIIGILVYIGLTALQVEFALPLAIIAGLLEVVPVIGPIISAIPAILIALTVSNVLALVVAGLYFVIQQLEGHLIVPQVMRKAVGINPLLVIAAVSVGGRLLGIGGALLAVPIAVVIQLILQEGILSEETISPDA